MFDIEQSMADWRRQMQAAGIHTPEPMDELESHLRADYDALVAAGKPEAEAFKLAVARLGPPGPVRAEFGKIENPAVWPVKIETRLWIGVALFMMAFLVYAALYRNRGWLLSAHIATVTAGYGAILLAGAFGLCHAWFRMFDTLSPRRFQSLHASAVSCLRIAAALVAVGIVLGFIWTWGKYGVYATGGWREAGGFCTGAWILAVWVAQRKGWLNERAVVLLSIGGNIVVAMAWFGGVALAAHGYQGLHGKLLWSLAAFIAVNLVGIIVGWSPGRNSREA